MNTAQDVRNRLADFADTVRAGHSQGFFKTGPGEYGEGDIFIGAKVPETRKVSREFKNLPGVEVEELLDSEVHEERLCAVFILVLQFKNSDEIGQERVYELFMKKAKDGRVNNWDLVDSSAPYIVGGYLSDKEDRQVLYEWAKSNNLWQQRIAMMGTFYFIRQQHEFDDALQIADILINHEHDLIHKAVGWMLREIGNVDRSVEEHFLKPRYKSMPRTMLRYAIEKFPEELRQGYLKGTV